MSDRTMLGETPTAHARHDILGVGVSAVSLTQTLSTMKRWIQRGERHYVCVTGIHGIVESYWDPDLRSIHNESGLTTPDGMPVFWLVRAAGYRNVTRVCGPDLLPEVCAVSARNGWRHYFYGGTEGVAPRLVEQLTNSFPGLNVVGAGAPPFPCPTETVDSEAVSAMNEARPDIVWVGLSTPKQERWMARHRALLDAPVLIGVGAAFDIHAGLRRRAPLWMQKSGLEWLFRMSQEPMRLTPRYLRTHSTFALLLATRTVASLVSSDGNRGSRTAWTEGPTTKQNPGDR